MLKTLVVSICLAPLVAGFAVPTSVIPSCLSRSKHSACRVVLVSGGSGLEPREEGRRLPSLRMAGVESSGISRKEKQRMKKMEKEAQRKVTKNVMESSEKFVDDLMDEVESSKRDIAMIEACIGGLKELHASVPEAAKAKSLRGDWKLAYTSSAETMNKFGTGLGSLPGTAIKEMFVSFNDKGRVEVNEIVRVLGPFPNLRNKLEGDWAFRKRAAGFAGDAAATEGLYVNYQKLTDARSKETTGETGFKVRDVALDLQFVNSEVLIIKIDGGDLVFETEPAMEIELSKLLRADLTKEGVEAEPPTSLIENIAQVATGAKSPWDAIFKK